MEYFLIFFEGIASFISPCVLPMVPIYIAYFAGDKKTGDKENDNKKTGDKGTGDKGTGDKETGDKKTGNKETGMTKTIANAMGFILGFTGIFIILSVFASQLGGIISENMKYIKIAFGIVIIIFGLNYTEILKIKWSTKWSIKSHQISMDMKKMNFLKSLLFGMLFSVSMTPCIGIFLGSALALISKNQDLVKGIILMLIYSAGLGIPFLISAILIERMKNVFKFIKNNYSIIRKLSGALLIVMGLYTMFSR